MCSRFNLKVVGVLLTKCSPWYWVLASTNVVQFGLLFLFKWYKTDNPFGG